MSDSEHILLAELERLAPSDISTEPDWGDVLRRANKHIGRRPRGAAPWKIVVALAVALAVAAPALAFTDGVRSLLGLGSTRPVPSTEQVLVSAPIGNGFYAHLVRSASTTGGRCLIVAADHAPTPALPITGGGGGSMCTVTDKRLNAATKSSPLATGFSITRRAKRGVSANWIPPTVDGNIYPGLHAARVEIRWRTGSHPLVLEHGYFLGGTPSLYMPPFRDFPFYVIAYNSAGQEVARHKLESPTLLMLHHGWKEYARRYHEWEKAHKR